MQTTRGCVVLELLGLSAHAETVYRLMLAEPAWGVVELTVHSGLSEVDVRAALDELADLALLRSSNGPEPVRAVSPQLGLVRLLAEAEADALRRQRQLESTRAAIAAIVEEQRNAADPVAPVHLPDVETVRARLRELADQTVAECLSLRPDAVHSAAAMAASKPVNEAVLARGVAIRSVYLDTCQRDPATVEYARWMAEHGGQIRCAPTVPMQLIVIDRTVAVVPLDPADSRRGALEVRSAGVVAALGELFDHIWAGATPLGTGPRRSGSGLKPQEQALLRLLGDGHTDESAGRKLGLSVRTVRRIMADLTERLSARSRFQAGVYAAQRGWI